MLPMPSTPGGDDGTDVTERFRATAHQLRAAVYQAHDGTRLRGAKRHHERDAPAWRTDP
jgi:hypothetical protein